MHATLLPFRQTPHQCDERVELLGRTGRGKIKVRRGNDFFAVNRTRLRDAANRHRALSDQELAALPWQGKGSDPEARDEAPHEAA